MDFPNSDLLITWERPESLNGLRLPPPENVQSYIIKYEAPNVKNCPEGGPTNPDDEPET